MDDVDAARVAGVTAIIAGLAMVAWAATNWLTHGALDTGDPRVGALALRTGKLLNVCWNLLLLPTALVLWARLQRTGEYALLLFTVAGVGSLFLWALGAATQGTPVLEVTYLLLAGIWWAGVGGVLRREARAVGTFTVILGVFSIWDAILTFFDVPFALYLTAAPKLPLSIVWDFWIGIYLLREGATNRS
jgi:hypothetical protein